MARHAPTLPRSCPPVSKSRFASNCHRGMGNNDHFAVGALDCISYSMTEQLQTALAILDEIVAGWDRPKPVPGYAHHIDLRPEALLEIAARFGAVEGAAFGDHRLQMTVGKAGEARVHKVYEVMDASGKLRSVLARLATVIDELRSPELKALEFDTSTEAERRKYELRQNSVHGFETTFHFDGECGVTALHIISSNGMPAGDLNGISFRIVRVRLSL